MLGSRRAAGSSKPSFQVFIAGGLIAGGVFGPRPAAFQYPVSKHATCPAASASSRRVFPRASRMAAICHCITAVQQAVWRLASSRTRFLPRTDVPPAPQRRGAFLQHAVGLKRKPQKLPDGFAFAVNVMGEAPFPDLRAQFRVYEDVDPEHLLFRELPVLGGNRGGGINRLSGRRGIDLEPFAIVSPFANKVLRVGFRFGDVFRRALGLIFERQFPRNIAGDLPINLVEPLLRITRTAEFPHLVTKADHIQIFGHGGGYAALERCASPACNPRSIKRRIASPSVSTSLVKRQALMALRSEGSIRSCRRSVFNSVSLMSRKICVVVRFDNMLDMCRSLIDDGVHQLTHVEDVRQMLSMKSLLLAAAAALSLGFSAPAAADPISVIGSAGGWRIKANPEVCVGDRTFLDSRTTLAFAVYVSGTANIIIQNRLWNIPAGSYPVDVSIDRGNPVTFETSFYAKEQALVLEWNLTAGQINLVSNGAVFYAKVGSANYQYSLAGSGEMLRAVMDCVADLRRAANPYAGAPSAAAPANPFAETASNPYRRM